MSLPVGLLRLATITKPYDPQKGLIEVEIDMSNISIDTRTPKNIQVPFSFYSNNGLFIGGYPEVGTPVIIGQGESGKWYFVSFFVANAPSIPKLISGEILIQAGNNAKISVNKTGPISIGSNNNKIYLDADKSFKIENFDSKLSFTEGSREINGPIKRDIKPNKYLSEDSKLTSPKFEELSFLIGLDPKTTVNYFISSSNKNPPLIEKRELIYEFAYSSEVDNEIFESSIYGKSQQPKQKYNLQNRRKSRTDTLSLSLVSPNFLIEKTSGTVVDIFGNILDINRNPLPIGTDDFTIKPDGNKDKTDAYLKIRELQRKSIAYHFEINAKKDLKGLNGKLQLPDINSNSDYSRNRSRLFLDIDKEGLLKLNVPASSESGNIPLLTRYENYSTFSEEDNNNPNKLIFNKDNKDIFLDSFAYDGGTISVVNDKDEVSTPLDRIIKNHIKHGTVYHDILQSLTSHQSSDFINYIYDTMLFDISSIPILDPNINPIVKNKIKIGENAGGRSGSLNFDGSLELNIGANTSDRQSLWLDTAGGIVGNIGRDKNFISAAVSMDGDLLMQIGGNGISNDSRFASLNNSFRGGAVDIRVFNDGFSCTLIRIDNEGVKIMTPGNLILQSNGDMLFRSSKNISMDAERVLINDREVLKFPPTSI